MATIWETIEEAERDENDNYVRSGTYALEISGLGVVLQRGGLGVYIPGARVLNGNVVREDRANPLNKGFIPPDAETLERSREGADEFDESSMLP